MVLPAAHLPHYPEYTKPAWYVFLSRDNRIISTPTLLTDIPHIRSGLRPRQVRIAVQATDKGECPLVLHVLSDTYFDTNLEVIIPLTVVAGELTGTERAVVEKMKSKFPSHFSQKQILRRLREMKKDSIAGRVKTIAPKGDLNPQRGESQPEGT